MHSLHRISRSWMQPVCSCLAYLLIMGIAQATPADAVHAGEAAFPVHPESLDELRRMDAHVVKLVREKLVPATVGVQGSSGVIVSADGVVACAAHTVARLGAGGAANVTTSDGKTHAAKVLAVFPEMDTAILRIDGAGPFVHVTPLQDDGDVTPGSWVIRCGYPRGYAQGGPGYVRLGRIVDRMENGNGAGATVFLDDVGVAGGDSGGPAFDVQGRLIGVVNTGGRGLRGGTHFTAIAPIVAPDVWGKVLEGKAEKMPAAPRKGVIVNVPDPPVPDRCLDVLQEMVRRPGDSVAVLVGPGGVRRLGTVCSANGMIVTKAGEWAKGTNVVCTLRDGVELTGSVVATEPRYDLALIVAQANDLMPVAWAETETPSVGQWVVACGPERTAIAAGTVGAVGIDGTAHKTSGQRTINAGGLGIQSGSRERQGTGSRSYPKLVWHTAWIQDAAELGGPLVDLDGKALGIAIERPSHVAGYMVPAAEVRAFLGKHAGAAASPDRRPSTDSAKTPGAP